MGSPNTSFHSSERQEAVRHQQPSESLRKAGQTDSGLTVVVGLQEHLQDTKKPTSEVHQHAADAPAHCALSLVIHEGL